MSSNQQIHLRSLAETQDYAASMVNRVKAGTVIALIGGLGSGKTAFAQGFARGMKISEHVGSPTFKLVSEYQSDKNKLFHIDCYRLKNIDEFINIGGENFLYPQDGITLIEWAEIIESILPDNCIRIKFERITEKPDERNLIVEGLI